MKVNDNDLFDFFSFLLRRTYRSELLHFDKKVLKLAFHETLKDVAYHYPNINLFNVWERITTNQNELAIFLYRIGRNFWLINNNDLILKKIHWLLKELCSCELYFSSAIGTGLYIFHGEGLVIGSRNVIGKGLRVYQNVTIGHKFVNCPGAQIGDDVKIYSGAKIIGSLSIGNNVIVGANTVLTKTIDQDKIVYGNPNIIKSLEKSDLI